MIYGRFKWNLLAALIMCVLAVSSCNPKSGNEHIVQNLQKQVPFMIIVPSYLPSGFYTYPIEIGEPDEGPYNSIGLGMGIKVF
jgi:hypothetical protein